MLNTLLALTVIAGAAAGPEPSESPPLLSGPAVADTNVTAASSTFSSEAGGQVRDMIGRDPAVFRQAVLALREAPEHLRPTPEQEAEIAKALRAYQQSEREFQRKFGPEIRRLRAAAQNDRARTPGAADQPGAQALDQRRTQRTDRPSDRPARTPDERPAPRPAQPAMDDPMMNDAMDPPAAANANLRRRAEEIMAQRPSGADLEKPIRAILTQPQRDWLDEKLTAIAKERFERSAMERYRREAQDQLKRLDERVNRAMEDLPPRLRERLESLSPEERAQALQRLRERREAGGRRSDRRGDAPAQPAPAKVPPTVDEIDIPSPTSGG